MNLREIALAAARELAMDSAHIPIVAGVLERHLQAAQREVLKDVKLHLFSVPAVPEIFRHKYRILLESTEQ